METSQKKYTLESLTALIRKNPDEAFQELRKMPQEDERFFLGAMAPDDYSEMLARAFVASLAASIEAEAETP